MKDKYLLFLTVAFGFVACDNLQDGQVKVPDKEALMVLDNYYSWRRTAEGQGWAE
ncbi:MAG: hypothetical protein ACOX7E_06095 [Paludibacter sp.]|jgi:hypothetical protein|nr:hypothetical protein [Paludibacter sp.]HOS45497.1 hypothetical protein [Paludibacter sp.]HPM09761.1 hypothetical protein [Paludibacter sp.]